jgi:hypothetical protein
MTGTTDVDRVNYINIAFLTFLAFLTVHGAAGTTIPFKEFDFNSGGYTLYGLTRESDPNDLARSLGHFYVDDVQTLNGIKARWVFDKEAPKYMCGYHYFLYLVKDGSTVATLYLNLNCKTISTGNGPSLHFEEEHLSAFKEKCLPLYEGSRGFPSIPTARGFWKKDREELGLFVPEDERPDWVEYEGSFDFECILPVPKVENYWEDGILLEPVRARIDRKFPGEKYELRTWATRNKGGSIICDVEIKSSHRLFSGFDLYRITEAWKPIQKPSLHYYSKKKRPFGLFLRLMERLEF